MLASYHPINIKSLTGSKGKGLLGAPPQVLPRLPTGPARPLEGCWPRAQRSMTRPQVGRLGVGTHREALWHAPPPAAALLARERGGHRDDATTRRPAAAVVPSRMAV